MSRSPPTICWYISDYGYGHASRSIAMIRAVLAAMPARVLVRAGVPAGFVRASLPDIEVYAGPNDIGVVLKDQTWQVDRPWTEQSLTAWVGGWETYIAAEQRFCAEHGVNLVMSDIAPQPFLVAESLGVPGIGVSNFTWHSIFASLFPGHPALDLIREAYTAADLGLVLPFDDGMEIFSKRRRIGLIARQITEPRSVLRRRYGLGEDQVVVYLGPGKGCPDLSPGAVQRLSDAGVTCVVSTAAETRARDLIRIPADETESQNYVGMSDLVVAKGGYSTVSEAVQARVPLVLFQREGFFEDHLFTDQVAACGIGREISGEEYRDGVWIADLDRLGDYRDHFDTLRPPYTTDGTAALLSSISEVVS